MSKLSGIFILVAGVIIGSISTYLIIPSLSKKTEYCDTKIKNLLFEYNVFTLEMLLSLKQGANVEVYIKPFNKSVSEGIKRLESEGFDKNDTELKENFERAKLFTTKST